MRNYEFAAGNKEDMFSAIGSDIDYVTPREFHPLNELPVAPEQINKQDKAVEKSLMRDQPQPYFNPYEVPMTQEDYEEEFGPIHPELEQIKSDEGYRNDVYKDSLGNLTVGTGHLLTDDMLAQYEEGDVLPDDELEALLLQDFDTARADAEAFTPKDAPQEVKNIVTNMAFQLGLPKLNKFKGFKTALVEKDYNKAADEMLDSLWASEEQTPERANRLADRMRALAVGD